jgi:hypothetical protein
MKCSRTTRFLIALATLLLAAMGAAVYAVAGHSPSGVPSYTGCLNVGTGKFLKFAVGDAPKSPCAGGEVEAHVSGGDITSVVGGIGLLGGAAAGNAVLRADPEVVQLRVTGSCGNTRSITAIAENGSVTCVPDDLGFSGYEVVSALSASDSTLSKTTDAVCPPAKKAIGGGGYYLGSPLQITRFSGPVSADRWRVSATEYPSHGSNWQLVVRVICAFTA